jgi:hypothetical protein
VKRAVGRMSSWGLSDASVELIADDAEITSRWAAYVSRVPPGSQGSSSVVRTELGVGILSPTGCEQLMNKTICVADARGCRKWVSAGHALTDFGWGAGWVARDHRERRVVGSLKSGAIGNPALVNAFVVWGVLHTLEILWEVLPAHLAVVHGSAVAWGDRAVLVLGGSGSGKTTAALALLEQGWTPLSDDLTIVDMSQPEPRIVSFLTFAHVSTQSLGLLPSLAPRLDGEDADDKGEFIVPMKTLCDAYRRPSISPVRLSTLALSRVDGAAETMVTRLSQTEASALLSERLDPFNRSRQDAIDRIRHLADHVVSIRSGRRMPAILHDGLRSLVDHADS